MVYFNILLSKYTCKVKFLGVYARGRAADRRAEVKQWRGKEEEAAGLPRPILSANQASFLFGETEGLSYRHAFAPHRAG